MSVRSALSGKHILLTGATGFVAKVWLSQVLWHVPGVGRITLLVRGRSDQTAQERIAAVLNTSPALRPLRERHGQDWAAWVNSRIEVLQADLSKPRCGLTVEDAARLAREIDVTVHSAGLTDFMPDPLLAIDANIDATENLADLVATFERPRMVHVSTCYVVGRKDGEVAESLEPGISPLGRPFDAQEVLAELRVACATESTRNRARARIDVGRAMAETYGFPNIYTFTKSLSERILCRRADLAVTIVRPSVVECAWRYPFPGWNEGINTAGPVSWLIASPFRSLPSVASHRFDVVPVDLVGRGLSLVTAAMLNDSSQAVYQLASSGLNPMTFGRCIELNGLAVRKATRNGGEQSWLRYLDPVASPITGTEFFTAGRARAMADWMKRTVRSSRPEERLPAALRDVVGDSFDRMRNEAARKLADTSRTLRRIDSLLDLFQPFTHDHDWIFQAHGVADLSAELPADERTLFAFDIEDLCWRAYWVDVEYPGLSKWCFPLIDGGTVPEDPPHEPPVTLTDLPDSLSRIA